MRKWKLLLFSIILIAEVAFANLKFFDKIVAIVNNDIILKSDIDNLINLVKFNENQINQQFLNNAVLRRRALERLITDQIILQISQKMGLYISDKKIDQIVDNILIDNNITVNQMRNLLDYNGISYTNYCDYIRKEILISKVKNSEVCRRINILPQEIDSLVKRINDRNAAIGIEFNLSHVLISLPEDPIEDQIIKVKNQAYSIIKQMRNGVNFDKLKIINSYDQQTLKYNHFAWKYIQDLPSIFAQLLNKAKKGDILGPVRSNIGFHILKVNDLRNRSRHISVTEVHARHILLKPSLMMTDRQVQTKLEQIAINIKNGRITFTDAAKRFSQDLHSASNGGDIGWVTTDIYDSVFYDILIRFGEKQLSTPVRSSVGWHLVEILDVHYTNEINAIQKNDIYRMLFNLKFLEEEVNWIQEQRINSYIRILGD